MLARAVGSERSEFLAVYGRRRVGKTFLVRRFFADQRVIYLEMIGQFGGDMATQLRIFSESVARTLYDGGPLAQPGSWHEAFAILRQAIERHSARRRSRFVLFFDELPWIATPRSGFMGELEHFWNGWCSRRDDVVLIVCGSAASWMLRRVVNARGGLHNRLTGTIRLLPFTLAETAQYFADRGIPFAPRQLVELYMVFGGVPHYLDHVQRGESVAQTVDRVVLSKDGALADEFGRLYASLFDDDETYTTIVRALAGKRRGLTRSELLAAADLPSGGSTTRILQNLVEGGFVSATIPFGRTSRDVVYALADELSLFHLKWLSARPPRTWQHVVGSPRWHAWAGLAFESVCAKHVAAIERALGIWGVRTEASTWLHRDAQIDLLIDRADGVISLCEMKFTDGPFTITKKYADELRGKLAAFRDRTGTRKAIHVVFVTSHGVKPNAHAAELVDREVRMEELVA